MHGYDGVAGTAGTAAGGETVDNRDGHRRGAGPRGPGRCQAGEREGAT
jgi:hypothetical protein